MRKLLDESPDGADVGGGGLVGWWTFEEGKGSRFAMDVTEGRFRSKLVGIGVKTSPSLGTLTSSKNGGGGGLGGIDGLGGGSTVTGGTLTEGSISSSTLAAAVAASPERGGGGGSIGGGGGGAVGEGGEDGEEMRLFELARRERKKRRLRRSLRARMAWCESEEITAGREPPPTPAWRERAACKVGRSVGG